MLGDSHAMSVAGEILQDIFGATERAFQVHHPVLSKGVRIPADGGPLR